MMTEKEFVTLDYGSGGRKTSQLISEMILPLLNCGHSTESAGYDIHPAGRKSETGVPDSGTPALCDGAVLEIPEGTGRMVFSTDSFVVSPYFFPGGDIGKLSVCGTVNDLAMMGAVPKYLSLSLILEEGMPFADLKKIIESIGKTAREAGVRIVTGDTKVVEKGRGDGIYINTTGIGFLEQTAGNVSGEASAQDSGNVSDGMISLKPENIQPGDVVLVSGNIGDHGTAVMLARNPGLGFTFAGNSNLESGSNSAGNDDFAASRNHDSGICSDCAPVHREALALVRGLGSGLRVMRDPTRGGLATTLNEFIEDRDDIGIELKETDIPVSPAVSTACEMLGLDPLYCACEGRLIAITAPECAEYALEILKNQPNGIGARIIGRVTGGRPEDHPGKLVIRTPLGTGRIAQKLSGAQLPRIC